MGKSPQEYWDKFMTSKQETLRLTIALEQFSAADISPAHRNAYLVYLRRRIRPAVTALVRGDDTVRLAALAENILIPTDTLNDALALAAAEKKIAALVWLLRWKRDAAVFSDRDFSL